MWQQSNAESGARGRDLTGLIIGAKGDPLATKLAGHPQGFRKLGARFIEPDEKRRDTLLQPVTPLPDAIESIADLGDAPCKNIAVLGPAEAQGDIRLMAWQ